VNGHGRAAAAPVSERFVLSRHQKSAIAYPEM